MASRKKTPATVATVVEATVATVEAPTTVEVPATTVAVPAVYNGVPFEALTPSQRAFATAKRPVTLAPALATGPVLTVNPGKPYRVASANNAHWWEAIQRALENGAGACPATEMVAHGACPKFVGYAVQRGWLIKA
jgi:hypothetical protein